MGWLLNHRELELARIVDGTSGVVFEIVDGAIVIGDNKVVDGYN